MKDIIDNNNKSLLKGLIPQRDLPIYGNSTIDPNDEVFKQPLNKVEITKTNGKWLVNGMPYDKLSYAEKLFFDEFLKATKL